MRRLIVLIFLLASLPSHAYLTSDVDVSTGYTSFSISSGENSINLMSLATLNFSYNLNNAAWNTALNLDMSEAMQSNQGPLAWTRVAGGFKFYPTGFNAQRVVFDNKIEGIYWRPAPFMGASLGLSNMSISNVGGQSGSLNASVMDAGLKAGAEVVITPNVFLTGQLSLIQGLVAQSSKTTFDISYTGMGVYMGIKIISL
ncbi:MAG: hypothetical protein HC902_08180 [Calothrix sp. SM1_5_4]|nr:hypothetical protein [Calothrix sp. SM1_5_4]